MLYEVCHLFDSWNISERIFRTRFCLVLSSVHNPTGKVLTGFELPRVPLFGLMGDRIETLVV